MPRRRLLLVATALLSACGGLPDPDAAWQVTLASAESEDFSGCSDGETYDVIDDSFTYEMYLDETQHFDLRIDGQTFATGQYADGCTIEYESPAWLDSYDEAEVQWQVTGTATVQGAAGGCQIATEGMDWEGQEIVVVTRSDAERLPAGCTRVVDVVGTLVQG